MNQKYLADQINVLYINAIDTVCTDASICVVDNAVESNVIILLVMKNALDVLSVNIIAVRFVENHVSIA
jgi:hypothetical protein